MTTVNVDLSGVASSTGPVDKVIFYSPVYREKNSGGLVSTREEVLILEDGVGSIELEPGPVTVRFQVQGIADTREKRGVVPDEGPVGVEDVIAGAFEYTPPVVNRGLDLIEGARDEALGQVGGAVDNAIGTRLDGKWDKGVIPQGTDLNIMTTPGIYLQWAREEALTAKNYPEDQAHGSLEVIVPDNESWPLQRYTTWTSPHRIYIRRVSGSWEALATSEDLESIGTLEGEVSNAVSVIANAPGNADKLVKLNQDGKLRVMTTSITDHQHVANREYVDTSRRRAPVATGDLDSITTPDVYRLATIEEATLENHYPEPGILGTLEVYSSGASEVATTFPTQRITTWSSTPRIYIRRYTGATWSRWQTFTSDAERSTRDFTTLDPDGYYAPAGPKLTLPTHDGSGQATHPSVLHFPEGFGGYRYWMAVTPFPNGNDDHEDPNVLASQDGTTWVTPDGLTNPLDDAPGTPQYNSDTCLSMGPGNTMWCFWRLYDRLNGAEVIYGRSTTDGVTWTPRVEIIRNDDSDGNLNRLLSPSLVYDSRGAGSWRLWVINTSDRSPDAHDSVKLKHTTGPTGWNFTAWQNVTVAPLQNRYRPWHMSVRYVEGKYVGILCASDSLVQATYDNLMLVGDSPTSFRVSSLPSIERTSSQHTSLYQGSMVPVVTPSGLEWDVFYSGIYAPTNAWHIFRTRMGRRKLGSLRDFIEEKLTPPDSGWRDISDTLREGWTGLVRIRRIGWEIFIELDNVTRESGTDHRMINLPRFGFLPPFSTRRSVLTSTRKPIGLSLYSWTGDMGSIQVEGSTIGDSLRGGFSFLTSDKPPSEWPGVPV